MLRTIEYTSRVFDQSRTALCLIIITIMVMGKCH